jgi:hypothetical protein
MNSKWKYILQRLPLYQFPFSDIVKRFSVMQYKHSGLAAMCKWQLKKMTAQI